MRIWLFLLLVPGILLAQQKTKIDSLEKVVNTGSIEARINAHHQLITELQGNDPGKAYRYISSLGILSEKNKNSAGLMFYHYQLGLYHNMKGNYDSLKYYSDKLLHLGKSKSLKRATAYGYHMTGTYYWQTGMFDKSTENHLKALKIRESMKDSAGIGASLASIGGVYLSTNKLDKARGFIEKAIMIGRKIGDDRLTLRSLHTLANLQGMSGQYDKALVTDKAALEICAKTNNLRGYSEIYSNMALCYYYKGDLDKALEYHTRVLGIDRFFKDDKQIGDTYLNLAQVYQAKGQFNRSVSLLNDALKLFTKTNHRYGLKNAYLALSDTYKEMADYKQAYESFQKYNKVANELVNEANNKNIERLNVQYETEQREQKIRNLSQQATIQKLQLKERNILLALAIGLIGIGMVLAYLFYRQRKLREDARLVEEINKQQQLAARAVMAAEEQERHRIANELHDGVGQIISGALMNLNILFQKVRLNNGEQKLAETSLNLLSDGYDELRTISHQMVPNTLMKKGLKCAIEDLLQKIDPSKIRTRFEASGLDHPLNKEVETALYRIIQETVNNTLKHAHATKLTVQLLRDDDGIFLSIEDNGRGFDLKNVDADGAGLRNIRSRVDFLRGNLEIESRAGKGTFFAIHLPIGIVEPVEV